MPKWNQFSCPNLFGKEKLFKDCCFKNDVTLKIKVHEDELCLDVNDERYSSYQDFLNLHIKYKTLSTSTTRFRRAIVKYDDLQSKNK